MKQYILFTSVFTLIFFTGCGKVFTGYGGELGKYDSIYTQSVCSDKFVDEKIKLKDDVILWTELGGSLKRKCKDYNASNSYFDITEDYYKKEVDLENFGQTATKTVGATIVNKNAIDYQGNVYEAIMVNAYKGLNFMSLGKSADARVEFNRALDRQRRAKAKFSNSIKKRQKELRKENKNSQVNSQKSESFVQQKYSQGLFKDFQAYPDFVNPFVTYMSALFFFTNKDYIKSRDLLKESVAMNPKNKAIVNDFKLVNQILARKNRNNKYIWLIYENGKSLKKNEFKLDLPLFLVSKKVLYTGIALPTLKEQLSSYNFLTINGKKTEVISDMDRVIKTEFKIKLPYIITKTVIRTVAKTVAQTQLSKNNQAAGIAMGIFNALTNKADVRSWVSLPKNFQVARVINGGNGAVVKSDNGEILENIQIPKDKSAIIYLTSSLHGYFVVHKILF